MLWKWKNMPFRMKAENSAESVVFWTPLMSTRNNDAGICTTTDAILV
jgi:hypothetical protein